MVDLEIHSTKVLGFEKTFRQMPQQKMLAKNKMGFLRLNPEQINMMLKWFVTLIKKCCVVIHKILYPPPSPPLQTFVDKKIVICKHHINVIPLYH